MSRELKIGVAAPVFRATAVGAEYGAGHEVSLADFRGTMLVLYFYPKDDTPGCTAQACGLRDAWGEIKDRAAVFGVSVDPRESRGSLRSFSSRFLSFLIPKRNRESLRCLGGEEYVWQEIHGRGADDVRDRWQWPDFSGFPQSKTGTTYRAVAASAPRKY